MKRVQLLYPIRMITATVYHRGPQNHISQQKLNLRLLLSWKHSEVKQLNIEA